MQNHKQNNIFLSVIMVMNLNFSRIFLVACIATSTVACSPTINNHGFDKEDIDFTKVSPGVSTREDVQQTLGSPTNISNFNPETWYYISKKTSSTAFLPAKTLDQTVVEITFSPSGTVTNVKTISGKEAREIKPVKRQTPTAGHDTSVLREVFSNFGRIAPKSAPRQ